MTGSMLLMGDNGDCRSNWMMMWRQHADDGGEGVRTLARRGDADAWRLAANPHAACSSEVVVVVPAGRTQLSGVGRTKC